MSFDAIVTAVAARFAPGVVTPPAGYRNISQSTGDLPNQLPKLPCVLVFLDSGTWTAFPSKRDGTHQLIVRFYFRQGGASDLARDMVGLRKWLDVLNTQLRGSTQLGGIVSSAWIGSWTIGRLEYEANSVYTGIEFGVSVVTNEGWAAVA